MAKVFVVAGGWDYEGHDFDSVRVFATRPAAEAYASDLTFRSFKDADVLFGVIEAPRYDYADVIEREVGA